MFRVRMTLSLDAARRRYVQTGERGRAVTVTVDDSEPRFADVRAVLWRAWSIDLSGSRVLATTDVGADGSRQRVPLDSVTAWTDPVELDAWPPVAADGRKGFQPVAEERLRAAVVQSIQANQGTIDP